MTPALADDIRIPEFVSEEWNQKLQAVAPTVQSPWAGVLYLNYALIDPSAAYKQLRNVLMDDGQTRSYSLYIASTRPNFQRGNVFSHFLILGYIQGHYLTICQQFRFTSCQKSSRRNDFNK